MNDDIKALVYKAAQGDSEAFTKLYELHIQAMYHYALNLCHGNDADAQEMVQEAFVSAFENLDQLQKPELFPLWLKRIVHSKCVRMFYKNRDANYDPDLLNHNMYVENRVDYLPEQQLENMTDREVVHELMKGLSLKQQEILDLFYFKQYSLKEISVQLDLPVGTIKSRVHEARKALKQRIIAYEKMEQRKISFHMDSVLPSMFSLYALKQITSHMSKLDQVLKVTSVVSMSACVIATSVALVKTVDVVQNHTEEAVEEQPVVKTQADQEIEQPVEFHEVTYQNETITNPRTAYYILMKTAPDEQAIAQLSEEEKQSLQPLVSSIKECNSAYKQSLEDKGWFIYF